MSRVKSTIPLLALLALVAFGFSACSGTVANRRDPQSGALLVPPYPSQGVWSTLADRRELYSPTFVNGPYTRSLMDGSWGDRGVKPVGEE
jgi:hypothetical protein